MELDSDSGDIDIGKCSSFHPIVEEWKNKYKDGTFCISTLQEYWRAEVPKHYSPQPNCNCLNMTFNKEEADAMLIAPLEQFISDSAHPEEVFMEIKKQDKPSSLCGKVFKLGEPTYSCRDCGLDPTCVLCIECFESSVHKGHRYKMNTSGGGGYCDCGDVEAWKEDPYCKVHIIGAPFQNDLEKPNLESAFMARVSSIFSIVIRYAHQILTHENCLGFPSELQPKEEDKDAVYGPLGLHFDATQTYTAIVYNDETHTYDQVMQMLVKAIDCTQKTAMELATMIDREGRSIVRCSGFKPCHLVKENIQRSISRSHQGALKVDVVAAHIVAHQKFAMHLLQWMQSLFSYSEGLKFVFTEIMTKPLDVTLTESAMESVILKNTQLWKSARVLWQHLLFSGMLMNYNTKVLFAKAFTSHYNQLMRDFIADDHDHSVCIVSLTVQIYTMPTIAHTLIAENQALEHIIRSLLAQFNSKINQDGVLVLDRASGHQCRRALYILYDLKYLLSIKPPIDMWPKLRKGFCSGFSSLLNLLDYIHNMDSVVRQVGQHMEYEPDWDNAFNLHIKLQPVITSILEWCGCDYQVFVRCYRATLKKLEKKCGAEMSKPCVTKELANHSVACIDFDVSTGSVSVHLPLCRLLAGLHLHLEKFDLSYDSTQFNFTGKMSPIQIMEPVLRTCVMIAQVQAGMWRRNGFSLVNQIFFYHNVRWRREMLDKDIILMQSCACLIPTDEFLIHLLNRYNLLNWAKEDFEETRKENSSEEDKIRQTITLVEEFLGLLITIVAERYTVGIGKVTSDDCIRKEIIQQLCVEPLTHSALSRLVPEQDVNETGIEDVSIVNQVATFSKSNVKTAKGKYNIKPEVCNEYNLFFYHYTREQQSKSEESQRKRNKEAGEAACCVPPPLVATTTAFKMLGNLFQCDVMLYLIKQILSRCANLKARSFSEAQFQKVLFFIGFALWEEQRCIKEADPFVQFTTRAAPYGILKILETLVGNGRIKAHADLLAWAIRKYKQVQAMQKGDSDGSEDLSVKKQDLVELQRKKQRAEEAALRRQRIMAKMSSAQKRFIQEHTELFEEAKSNQAISRSDSDMDLFEGSTSEEQVKRIALGPNQSARMLEQSSFTCILCQEDQQVGADFPAMVLAAYVQQSTVLSQNSTANITDKVEPLLLSSLLSRGPHTTSCGHVMHASCWQKFFDSIVVKESRRPQRYRFHHSFSVANKEFLCPLCECLSNTVLPIVPPLWNLQRPISTHLPSLPSWINFIIGLKKVPVKESGEEQLEYEEQGGSVCVKVSYQKASLEDSIAGNNHADEIRTMFHCPYKAAKFSTSLLEMIELYCQSAYTVGLGVLPQEDSPLIPLLVWQSVTYTLHSTEMLLREQNKALMGELSVRQRDSLQSLIRLAAALPSCVNTSVMQHHCLSVINLLDSEYFSIIDVDAGSLLVTLSMSLHGMFLSERYPSIPKGDDKDLLATSLVFIVHIAQILILTEFTEEQMEVESYAETELNPDEAAVHSFYESVCKALGREVPNVSAQQILSRVKTATIPWLRFSCLFWHFITGVVPPAQLGESGGDSFDVMVSYLGLDSVISQGLVCDETLALITRWCSNSKVSKSVCRNIMYPLQPRRLINLPDDYSDLINNTCAFTCPKTDGDDSRSPAMCLVCGEILCSQSYCCQVETEDGNFVGPCTNHALLCGAGVGLFLRIRECKLLMLVPKNKGCFQVAPYLDEYGEPDQNLDRGNPLHLCHELYKSLHIRWLQHGIPEQVVHHMEAKPNSQSEWHYF